jgi:hypothetical protein
MPAAGARESTTATTATTTFDGIDDPAARDGGGQFNPAAYPRRLTADVLDNLRRRRTGVGRGVRRPLNRRPSRYGSDEDDSDDEDLENETFLSLIFGCCCGPRCIISVCMLMVALVTWSFAVSSGMLRQPSYKQMVTPIRVARQRLMHGKPTSADDGFVLFDRDADGKIDVEDMAMVAQITTGEVPTDDQLRAYIAKGDTDGDGALDEKEYLDLLHRERAEKKSSNAGGRS